MARINKRVVLTGGPGAGKTTVLERLRQQGYRVVPEVARAVIADRKAQGLDPRPAPLEFARTLLARDIEQYPASAEALTFFDRSILDSLGMLSACGGLSDAELEELLQQFPYHSPVFVFPPWGEIYRTDSERDQSFEEAVRVHESISNWYLQCGYEVSTVPVGPVDERCAHILQALGER